jgi:hypothetical protein
MIHPWCVDFPAPIVRTRSTGLKTRLYAINPSLDGVTFKIQKFVNAFHQNLRVAKLSAWKARQSLPCLLAAQPRAPLLLRSTRMPSAPFRSAACLSDRSLYGVSTRISFWDFAVRYTAADQLPHCRRPLRLIQFQIYN